MPRGPRRTPPAQTYIYALCSPSGAIRYVGKADNPAKRYAAHLLPSQLRVRTAKNNWLRGLLDRGELPVLRVLDTVPFELWEVAERAWIADLRAVGCRLLNGTDGGDGGALAPEIARAAGETRRGRKLSAESRACMSETHRRRCADPEVRAAMRDAAIRAGCKPPLRRGQDSNLSALTAVDVVAIREAHAGGASATTLAETFGVTPANVSQIVTGRSWRHVGGPTRAARAKQKLTNAQVDEIRHLVGAGLKQTQVAARFGVDPSHVSDIVRGVRRATEGKSE